MGLSIGDIFKPSNLLMVGATAGIGAALLPGGFALGAFLKIGGATLGLQALSLALIKEPKAATPGYTGGSVTLTTQEPAASRKLVYGHLRVGGTIVYKESTHNDRLLHLIVVLADHEVEAIDDVYFNDELATSLRFYDNIISTPNIKITSGLGSGWFLQDASNTLNMRDLFGHSRGSLQIFEIEGSNNNDGVYEIKDTSGQDVTENWVAISRIDGGTIVAEDPYTTSPQYNVTYRFRYAWINKHLGTTDQTADSDLLAYSDQVDSNFRLRGCAYIYVMLAYRKSGGYKAISQSSHPFAQGLPNITARVRGMKMSWESPHLYTPNAAAVIRHYIEDTRHGLGGTVNSTNYSSAYSTCDASVDNVFTKVPFDGGTVAYVIGETVRGLTSGATGLVTDVVVSSGAWHTLDAAGYLWITDYDEGSNSPEGFQDDEILWGVEPSDNHPFAYVNGSTSTGNDYRYRIDALVDTGLARQQILEQMRRAIAGDIVYSQGEWYIYPGVYSAPDADHDFDESDIRSGITVTSALPTNAGINAVRGTFVSRHHDYQITDFPPITSDEYLAQDDGVRRWADLELLYVSGSSQAQRIAKIELLRARQPLTIQTELSHVGFQLRAGDRLTLTNAKFGWADKIFRVEEWAFRINNDLTLTCPVTLREDVSTIYDWTTNEESSIDPAPNTNLPDPWTVQAPPNLQADGSEAQLFIAPDGTVRDRVLISWSEITDIYVLNNGSIEIQYLEEVESIWRDAALLAGNAHNYYLTSLQSGLTYQYRARCINSLGLRSAWAITGFLFFEGKTAPPPRLLSFTVHRQADGTREYKWAIDNPPLDLVGVKIRYAVSTGAYIRWADMELLYTIGGREGVITTSPWENNLLPAGNYTFSCIAVDTSNNPTDTYLASLSAAEEEAYVYQIGVVLDDPRITDILDQFDFVALGWPGTKTNCMVDSITGALLPNGTDQWWDGSSSPQPTWATYTTWNDNPVATFSYVHSIIDLTGEEDKLVTFTPTVSLIVDGVAVVSERHSDDGSTYTSYSAIGTTLTTRFIQIKIEVTT